MKAMSLSTSDIDLNVPVSIKSCLRISHGENEMLRAAFSREARRLTFFQYWKRNLFFPVLKIRPACSIGAKNLMQQSSWA